MAPHESSATLALPSPTPPAGRRTAWHALAVVLAATVAWLIFTAYRQPDLLLDLASLRLC